MDATLEKQVDRLGRSSRIAAGVTVLGVVGVGLAMAYASWQLGTLQKDVAASEAQLIQVNQLREKAAKEAATLQQEITRAEAEKREYQAQVSELTSKVKGLQHLLERTTDLSRFRHNVDWVALKYTASENPAEARVLERVLRLRDQNVGWSLGGTQPEQGFDSPSFAAYVLQSLGLLPNSEAAAGRDLLQRSRLLRSILPRVDEPKIGDLVFYPGGFALFFFRDQNHQPFVIGMTPSGIVALEPNFAFVEGAARPNYRR